MQLRRATDRAEALRTLLPKVTDPRGNLSIIEGGQHVPFDIKRTYWIYDVPGGEARGGHALRTTTEFIVALSGSFDVHLHDGHKETIVPLARSYYGLLVPKMTWRRLENFSTNSVCLVLADTAFAEPDYIRDLDAFVAEAQRAGRPAQEAA